MKTLNRVAAVLTMGLGTWLIAPDVRAEVSCGSLDTSRWSVSSSDVETPLEDRNGKCQAGEIRVRRIDNNNNLSVYCASIESCTGGLSVLCTKRDTSLPYGQQVPQYYCASCTGNQEDCQADI